MTDRTKPKMPPNLGAAGRELWKAMDPGRIFTFEPGELTVLAAACRQADDVRALEIIIAGGMIVLGSNGQPRLSAAVTEARQGRLALAKLLAELSLPAESQPVGLTPAGLRATKAATARWDRQRAKQRGIS